MPGFANWKDLFIEEYHQLELEGFDLSDAPKMADSNSRILPFPGWSGEGECDEAVWESAYHELWKIYESGKKRPDYDFVEPNDFEGIMAEACEAPHLESLSDEEYASRIHGAVTGRIAGVIQGKPAEIDTRLPKMKDYLTKANAWPLNDFLPPKSEGAEIRMREDCMMSTKGNITYAQIDDDINYTVMGYLLACKHGNDVTPQNVADIWMWNMPYYYVYCASRQAYFNYINGVPIDKIPTYLNPWRECIDGQIRTDIWGYTNPADLYGAAKGAYNDTSFSLVRNGIYGGMFVAGCIAAALSKNPNIDKILQGGLAVIPKKSRLAQTVRDVWDWYRETPDYEIVCEKIYDKYGFMPFAGTENNIAIVVLALLAGNLDFGKTISVATVCGYDTDCNAGTAGSIVGAAIGIENIEKRWYEDFNDTVHTAVATMGNLSITKFADDVIKLKK